VTPTTPTRKQTTAELFAEGFKSAEIFKQTVEHKLKGLARGEWWENFQKCGNQEWWRTCTLCGRTETYHYACNLKWCPACNWKITNRRKKELELVTLGITQPKHLVLTQRNFPVLTRRKISESRSHLVKLRRKKLMTEVQGGCASLEFTNESRGWHMHWHLLVDARWINIEEVSRRWGRLVGQEFAIVKVKDVREKSYLQEVCKYVVVGSELARWQPEMILEFVHALKGTRLFSCFGSFIQRRQHAKAVIATQRAGAICECGCSKFRFDNEVTEIMRDNRK